ncbi:MAG: hypothetical protein KatS3mg005_1571 [Bryobacteraceae bacterium]|nr:MAG: hypothetical protein KatS3mg005_1571 [Bryobacteraceae bacterium]
MNVIEIQRPIRLLAFVVPVISMAGLLVGLARPGRAEPPYPPCQSCYVELRDTVKCKGPYNMDCTMSGCYGGSGHCRSGCLAGMTYLGEHCANVGCGWTQSSCANWDCYCDDWW